MFTVIAMTFAYYYSYEICCTFFLLHIKFYMSYSTGDCILYLFKLIDDCTVKDFKDYAYI